ncbi:sugar transferase [Verrucomicrobia bacterium]|nr:sugar transferase [Verrucomicrobiota bacterium]MDB4665130.1 sugar transferase [Verrucomicrobiota bacterium]
MKRCFDFISAFVGLLILSPLLVVVIVLIWLQDFHSPFYMAPRMRRRGVTFKMVKLRSMVSNADKIGGTSTAGTDKRITWVGRFIRKLKLDEFSQLWNVLIGDMSLVGPRPQAPFDASLYTEEENKLFEVRPGITDFSSIVFADEGDILKDAEDADLQYNQVIRPWKSRLGLFYAKHHSLMIDIKLIFLTLLGIISRDYALRGVQKILNDLAADETLVRVAGRKEELKPFPPPGGNEIVESLSESDQKSSV